MMSGFKPGDRVHVEFDATVNSNLGSRLSLMADGRTHVDAWVFPEHCTRIVPPFAVGDVLDSTDAIEALPAGAVVRDIDGNLGRRASGGDWAITGHQGLYSSGSGLFKGSVTVLWLPS